MKQFLRRITIVLLNAVVIGSLSGAGNATDGADRAAPDPSDASYFIAGQPIALVDGHRESPAAPGSAMKVRTAVWKQPVFGDLDGDSDQPTSEASHQSCIIWQCCLT